MTSTDASLSPSPRTGITSYTKADIDAMLGDVYTKGEVNAKFTTNLKVLTMLGAASFTNLKESNKNCFETCTKIKEYCLFGFVRNETRIGGDTYSFDEVVECDDLLQVGGSKTINGDYSEKKAKCFCSTL